MSKLDERNEAIIEAYSMGTSTKRLGIDFGLSERQIWNIVGGKKKPLARPTVPISPWHQALGQRFSAQRYLGRWMEPPELAAYVGLQVVYLRDFEKGMYDATMTQLQRIAKYLDMPLSEFIKPGETDGPSHRVTKGLLPDGEKV